MTHKNEFRARIEHFLDRRQRGNNSIIVGNLTVSQRDVEIDPDQNLLARNVNISNRLGSHSFSLN